VSYPGAVLVISHDRRFLNKVVTQIIELSPVDHKLTTYQGNYDDYLTERSRLRYKQVEAYQEQQDELKTLQKMLKAKTYGTPAPKPMKDGNKMAYDKHGASVEQHIRREIRLAKRRVEDILDDPMQRPAHRWKIKADFAPDDLVSREIIRLHRVSKSYGERTLILEASTTISSGDRVVFYGPNGLGKTTLLKLILGLESPDAGEIRVAGAARIGYLDQQQETLDPNRTVFEAYSYDLTGSEGDLQADLHKYGLFSENEIHQKISSLSVGQKRKLQIAKLIASKANVLLLDEPTNHLDLESVERFEQALVEFPGTILAISHDRMFIEKVATITWTLEAARLVVTQVS
jgi:macrolide transport system ATP-binding/permease protein